MRAKATSPNCPAVFRRHVSPTRLTVNVRQLWHFECIFDRWKSAQHIWGLRYTAFHIRLAAWRSDLLVWEMRSKKKVRETGGAVIQLTQLYKITNWYLCFAQGYSENEIRKKRQDCGIRCCQETYSFKSEDWWVNGKVKSEALMGTRTMQIEQWDWVFEWKSLDSDILMVCCSE